MTAALAVFAMLGAAPAVHAQEPIQATVDRTMVRINESFTLVLRAEGPVRGEPETAPLAAQFDILNSMSSRRIGIVNTRAAEVNEWQYQLMPKSAGDFTIPPLRIGDRQTTAVSVRVLAPDPAATAAADIFMELVAQPDVVYAQSQILFTLRLYVGVSTGRATLTAPETTGVEAIVEKLGEDAAYKTTRGGRTFDVRERRYAVFPQQAGMLTIGPVTFEAMVIPDRGFSRVQRFRSDVLELAVQPAVAPPAALETAAWLPAQQVTLTEQWSEPEGDLDGRHSADSHDRRRSGRSARDPVARRARSTRSPVSGSTPTGPSSRARSRPRVLGRGAASATPSSLRRRARSRSPECSCRGGT